MAKTFISAFGNVSVSKYTYAYAGEMGRAVKENRVAGMQQRKGAQPNSHYLIEHIVRPEPRGSQSPADKIRF